MTIAPLAAAAGDIVLRDGDALGAVGAADGVLTRRDGWTTTAVSDGDALPGAGGTAVIVGETGTGAGTACGGCTGFCAGAATVTADAGFEVAGGAGDRYARVSQVTPTQRAIPNMMAEAR